MPMRPGDIEAEALGLAPSDRARLAEKLISSLDPDPEIEAAWLAEAVRRHREIVRGDVEGVPGADALERLKSEFS